MIRSAARSGAAAAAAAAGSWQTIATRSMVLLDLALPVAACCSRAAGRVAARRGDRNLPSRDDPDDSSSQ
eukprot:9499039-Pyramimonas_sp.AAC.1